MTSHPASPTERQHDLAADVALITESGLFDREWYVSRYPDVAALGLDPASHYLTYGAAQGLEPGPRFWSAWYREVFPDVGSSGVNPLLHYLRHGTRSRLANEFRATGHNVDADVERREPVNMFWHGDTLSAMEGACMRSFVSHGHELHVFSYTPLSLPAGVIGEDASRILPFERYFSFMESPSAFSNIFRYKLLLERGGWWVDTDVVCLASRLPACTHYWAVQDAFEDNGINGAILKFPAGDPFCERLLALSQERVTALSAWGQLGPRLLTEVLASYRPDGLAGSTSDCYPLRWVETYLCWLPEFAAAVDDRCEGAHFLHLWHRMFSEMGIDVNRRPPQGSFLEQLCESVGQPLTGAPDDLVRTRQAVARYLNRDWNLNHLSECIGKDLTGVIPIHG